MPAYKNVKVGSVVTVILHNQKVAMEVTQISGENREWKMAKLEAASNTNDNVVAYIPLHSSEIA